MLCYSIIYSIFLHNQTCSNVSSYRIFLSRCPPCRRFTPKLIQLYKTLKEQSKNIELVFCSLDKKESEYKEYTSDMPWYSMPFDSPISRKLATTYKAQVGSYFASNLTGDQSHECLIYFSLSYILNMIDYNLICTTNQMILLNQ